MSTPLLRMVCLTLQSLSVGSLHRPPSASRSGPSSRRTGNDINPCSLTQPCRGFTAAIAQVIAGGEVIALDSAAYGPVTITQSVSIIGPAGVYVGISVIPPTNTVA